jgi:pullulanase/glycogen debranching enzyme
VAHDDKHNEANGEATRVGAPSGATTTPTARTTSSPGPTGSAPTRRCSSSRAASSGRRIIDDSFYLLFNAHHEPVAFRLPRGPWGRRWTKVLATREPLPEAGERVHQAGVEVEGRSVIVLRRVR